MILPRVKTEKNKKGSYILPFGMNICVDEKYREKLSELTGLFLPNATVSYCDNGNITIVDSGEDNENYVLDISENGIEIKCGTYLGVRNAMATLSQLAKPNAKGFEFECTTIEDGCETYYRGIMLDLARGAKPYNKLIEDIVLMGKLKINILHLHLFDSQGLCVRLDSVPEVCCVENYYSKDQMRYVVHLADVLGMEVIPEWDMPGHSSKLFEGVDGIECDIPEGAERFVWAACVGTEKTYEVYEKIINELVELFPGRYFHIGGDEVHFEDGRPYGYICHWMECSKCRALMEREGMTDIFDLYNYFVLRIYEIVKKAGRTMMMWSDWLDCTKPDVLPDDIVMHFWRVAAEGRGPYIDSSMNNQLKMGYKVINSYYEDTYFCNELYINTERLADWHWLKSPESDEELKKNILGSVGCCWEYGNQKGYPHYARTFAPTTALFADKLWNGDRLQYTDEYIAALNRSMFGINTPENLNVFDCIGDLIPPREVFPRIMFARTVLPPIAYFDRLKCSSDDVRKTEKALRNMENIDKYCEDRIETFAEYLGRVADKMDEM